MCVGGGGGLSSLKVQLYVLILYFDPVQVRGIAKTLAIKSLEVPPLVHHVVQSKTISLILDGINTPEYYEI